MGNRFKPSPRFLLLPHLPSPSPASSSGCCKTPGVAGKVGSAVRLLGQILSLPFTQLCDLGQVA